MLVIISLIFAMDTSQQITDNDFEIAFIINILRHGSIKWPGRSICFKRHRKKVFVRNSKEGTPIYKYHWQCGVCRKWYKNQKELEVDHIVEVGPFKGDWNEYIERLFCSQENLQCLCISCHQKKTNEYAISRKNWVRK